MVTVTGTGFTGATSATVCGAALSSLVVVNDTALTGTTPAHTATATACDVVVTTAGGSGTGTALFSYVPVANPTPVPTLGQWAVALLSLMAAALGAGALRRNGDRFRGVF